MRDVSHIRDINMFVSRVAVSLRIPSLEEKSLVKITSLVRNRRMVEVYTMDKLVRVLRNFGIVVSKPNCLLCSFNLVSKALSVCP